MQFLEELQEKISGGAIEGISRDISDTGEILKISLVDTSAEISKGFVRGIPGGTRGEIFAAFY